MQTRTRITADSIRKGDTLPMHGGKAVQTVTKSRKGNVQAFVGTGVPITFAPKAQVWVLR